MCCYVVVGIEILSYCNCFAFSVVLFAFGVVFFCFFRLSFASVVVVVVIAVFVISHVALGRLRTGTFRQPLCFCHGQVDLS